MDNLLFGSTLRMLRTAAGMSLREMAKRIHVSPAYLSQIEMGKLPPPTYDRIERIAEVIGIPFSSILEISERIDPEIRSLLTDQPELLHLIQFAVEVGFEAKDFQEIMNVIAELGVKGFRKLLRYGQNHPSEFKLSRSTQSNFEALQKYQQNIQFREFVEPGLVFPNIALSKKKEVIRFLVDESCAGHPSIDADFVYEKLIASEDEATSGIGNGVAIPHLFIDGIDKRIFSIGRIPQGILFAAVDNKPVYLICLLLDTDKSYQSHLNLLAYLAHRFHSPRLKEDVRKANTKEKIISLLFDLRPPSLN